jgi:hypothetical protein
MDEHAFRSFPAEVEIDHEVRPAGENCHLGGTGNVIECIVQVPRDMDAHARIIPFAPEPARLAFGAREGRRDAARGVAR